MQEIWVSIYLQYDYVPYLVTEQHWLCAELFPALMAGQFGGVNGATLCRFQGLARGWSGQSLPWDRGG